MRLLAVTALVSACLYLVPAARSAETTQVPTVQVDPNQPAPHPTDDNDDDPRDNRKKALTPEEEMQRQIRLFDPLDRSSQPQKPSQQPQSSGPTQGQGQNQNQDPRQPNYSTPVNQPLNQPSPNPNDAGADGTYGIAPETPDQALPGSIEAGRLENQTPGVGPRVEEDAGGTESAEYTGPAVLTRAYSINTLAIPDDMRIHESATFSEVWDSSVATPGPNSTTPATGFTTGASFGWGISGQHKFDKNDVLGFAYSGNATVYTSFGAYTGSNHRATLNLAHSFSRRLGLTFVNSGSIYSANYAAQNPVPAPGTSIANANLSSSPTLQPYASGSKQFNSLLGVNWQQTARWSYNFSSGFFTIGQDGPGLIGAMGMQAQGAVNYRYSHRTTVGLYYAYSHNSYPHGFGSSDSNSGGLSYALALNRTTQFRLRAGLARTEAIAETPVVVSPIVYQLFGSPLAIVDQYNRTTTSDLSGQLTRDLGRSMAASLAFVRGISPGNGQLLTSTQEVISASFSMRLHRVYTLQFSAMSQSLSAIAQTLSQSYHADVGQFSLSRKYRSGVSANLAVSYSYFGHQSAFITPYEIHISSGITWSPTNSRLWPF